MSSKPSPSHLRQTACYIQFALCQFITALVSSPCTACSAPFPLSVPTDADPELPADAVPVREVPAGPRTDGAAQGQYDPGGRLQRPGAAPSHRGLPGDGEMMLG